MKFLFDYFPIVCFFIAYKFWGIYVATSVAMATSALQLAAYWLKHRRFEKLHLIVFILIFVFGSLTLIFHNALFIKWKPSIAYWMFAIVLLGSHLVGSKKPLMRRMLKDKISLPDKVWVHLNTSWAIFFLFLGALNVYVLYHYSTNAWVYFKLIGTLGLMLIFIVGQAIYMSRHVQKDDNLSNNHEG